MTEPKTKVVLIVEDEEPSREFLDNNFHNLKVYVSKNGPFEDVYLKFSSRLAMSEFAQSLMAEAYYGEGGMQERNPQDGLVVNRVRLTDDSSRFFVFYDDESPVPG